MDLAQLVWLGLKKGEKENKWILSQPTQIVFVKVVFDKTNPYAFFMYFISLLF